MSFLNGSDLTQHIRKPVKEFTFGIFEDTPINSQVTNSDEIVDGVQTQSPTDFAKLINSTPFKKQKSFSDKR